MEMPASENPSASEVPSPRSDSGNRDEQVWTVQKILNWTTGHLQKNGSSSARLESEVLLAHARGCERIQLYTDFNMLVDEPTRAKMRSLVQRRIQGEPVAYLVGYREFFSLEFDLLPGVFIPRPETESLVLDALSKLETIPSPQILELCVGSGCISVSLAVQKPGAKIVAVDKNQLACETTAKNIAKHHVNESVQVLQGDLFDALNQLANSENKTFDLLISNPPYVCTHEIAELERDIQHFEPHAALDGGADGLDIIRVILEQAPAYIKPGGWCLLEMDPAQIATCLELATASGHWANCNSIKDMTGNQRCVVLQRCE